MRKGDSSPAVKQAFADGSDGAGVINICSQVPAVVYPAKNPLRVGHGLEEAEAGAIRRRAVDGEPIAAARLEADAFPPGDGVAHPGLRAGGRDDDRFSESASRGDERGQTGRVDPVIVSQEKLHLINLQPHSNYPLAGT